jgi:hypothetical protein
MSIYYLSFQQIVISKQGEKHSASHLLTGIIRRTENGMAWQWYGRCASPHPIRRIASYLLDTGEIRSKSGGKRARSIRQVPGDLPIEQRYGQS